METTYSVIGADGREYGPVSSQQLRDWITQFRADAATKVKADAGDWVLLGTLPEFAEALASRPAPPPLPPTAAPPPPPSANPVSNDPWERWVTDPATRQLDLDITGCFGRAWTLFTQHPWLFMGATALFLLSELLLHFIPPGVIVGVVLFGPLWAGYQLLQLRLARGQHAGLDTMFSGFQRGFVQLMVLGTMILIFIAVGLTLLVLPGLYLLVVLGIFPFLLVADRGLEFWPAICISVKLSHQHFWKLLLFFALAALLSISGVLACGFGLLITIPWSCAALVHAYEEMFRTAPPARPAYA